jgi:hypothetical protein
VRTRVEHAFGHQENAMGRKIVRTIGMARARNMRRLVHLERMGSGACFEDVRVGRVCVALCKPAPPQQVEHQKLSP